MVLCACWLSVGPIVPWLILSCTWMHAWIHSYYICIHSPPNSLLFPHNLKKLNDSWLSRLTLRQHVHVWDFSNWPGLSAKNKAKLSLLLLELMKRQWNWSLKIFVKLYYRNNKIHKKLFPCINLSKVILI